MSKSLKPMFEEVQKEDYLEAAQKVANWITGYEIQTDTGIYWDKGEPKNKAKDFPLSIYSGAAGIILFFIEIYQVTKEPQYLEKAILGGKYLAETLNTIDLTEHHPGADALDYPNTEWMSSSGYTGEAWLLIELYKLTEIEFFKEVAHKVFGTFVQQARATEAGLEWTGQPCIMLDGGMILHLIDAADFFKNDAWKEAAIKAGYQVLTKEVKIDADISKFDAFDPQQLAKLVGAKSALNYEWPNFIMGTAGIVYLLGRLYQISADEAFLAGARKGANYIISIQKNIGADAALVPLRLPDKTDLFYVSYCHGPVGTARGFQLLFEITGEAQYRDEVIKLANGILRTGAPYEHSRGYWHSYNYCCGTAGILDFFLDVNKAEADDAYLPPAIDAANKILSEGLVTPGGGAKWYGHWNRNAPTEYTADLGYFDGAAGIGTSLLHLYAALSGDHHKLYSPLQPQYAK